MVAKRKIVSGSQKLLNGGLLGAAALMAISNMGFAATTYTWNGLLAGTDAWGVNGNWTPNTAFPNVAGDVANLTATLSGDLAIGTGTTAAANAARTLGTINIGDAGGLHHYTIGASAGGNFSFTLDNSGNGAQINQSSTSAGDQIGTTGAIGAIIIADTNTTTALTISNASASLFTLTGNTSSGALTSANVVYNANGNGGITETGTQSNAGTITNSGTGNGTVTIGGTGGIGVKVTSIIQASNTSALVTGLENQASQNKVFTSTGTALFTYGQLGGTGSNVTFSANSSGNITGSAAVGNTGTISNLGSGTGTVTIGGIISTAITGVTQNAANSMLVLNGNNTFTSDLTIISGTVQAGGGPGAASATGRGALQLGDSTLNNSNNATLLLTQTGTQTSQFNTAINVRAGSLGTLAIKSQSPGTVAEVVPTAALNLFNNLSLASLNANTLNVGSTISGANTTIITVDSTNLGVVAINADNHLTFSGALAVNAGTLQVGTTGNVNGASGVTINGSTAVFNYINSTTALTPSITFGTSGGTLAGNGTFSPIGGVSVTNGGAVSPNGPTGGVANKQTYTTGLSLASGTIYKWDFKNGNAAGTAGTDYDELVVNSGSNLTITGGAKLSLTFTAATDFTNVFWDSPQTFTIASVNAGGGTTSGSFADGDISVQGGAGTVTFSGNSAVGQGSFSTSVVNNDELLTWTPATPTPEPASLALLGLGAAALIARRRKM